MIKIKSNPAGICFILVAARSRARMSEYHHFAKISKHSIEIIQFHRHPSSCRQEPSQSKPSRAKPSQAEPSQAEPRSTKIALTLQMFIISAGNSGKEYYCPLFGVDGGILLCPSLLAPFSSGQLRRCRIDK